MQEEVVNTILKELREFRTEENKRWEENDKCWDANDKRLTSLEQATEENTKAIVELKIQINGLDTKVSSLEQVTKENTERISSLEKATKENTERISSLEKATKENTERIINLEKETKENTQNINNLIKTRKKDRLELIDVLDTMDKSISKRFDEMEENISLNFNKIYAIDLKNDVNHIEFKQILQVLGANDSEAANRIEKLEEWKNSIDGSLFAV